MKTFVFMLFTHFKFRVAVNLFCFVLFSFLFFFFNWQNSFDILEISPFFETLFVLPFHHVLNLAAVFFIKQKFFLLIYSNKAFCNPCIPLFYSN